MEVINPTNLENVKNFVDSFDTFLFDCDGILWTIAKQELIPGAVEALKMLRKLGKKIFFMTNNSLLTREDFVRKFDKMKIEAHIDEIICNGHVTAWYLKEQCNYQGKVYLIGNESIGKELDLAGIKHTGLGTDVFPDDYDYNKYEYEIDPEVSCVVVAMDFQFSYRKIARAVGYLYKTGNKCLFIGTDSHSSHPAGKYWIPGTGAMVESIEHAADRKATIIGKPAQPMIDYLQKIHKIDKNRTVIFGDTLDSDVKCANMNGFKAVLVATGRNTYDDARRHSYSLLEEDQKLVPHYYMDTIEVINAYPSSS